MKRKVWSSALALSCVLALTSCNNSDLYDPAKAEEALKQEYGDKFIAKYGSFGADYSWDASSLSPHYSATRANIIYTPTESKDYYQVENTTLNWMKNKLPGGTNNKDLGTPFAMTVPNNSFTIVPIYQGSASMIWDLYMVVGEGNNKIETKIWTKNQGIQTQKNKNDNKWSNLTNNNNNTDNVYAIRSKQYTFDLSQRTGDLLYFYLKITKGLDGYGKVGDQQSSLNHTMLNLSCPKPSNIKESDEVMIIGCEDAGGKESDWDMNDVVFLIYGNPEVPKPIEVIDQEIVESKTKRYMIEDLGSTDDFDFNDIVVDVTESVTKKLTLTNGVITGTEITKSEQNAVIRHLGGAIPFTLKIGDTELEEMEGQMGKNPDTEFTVKGWKPGENNISIKVRENKNGSIYTVTFPEEGEIPMIIATDPEVGWMEERIPITKEWFDSLKK